MPLVFLITVSVSSKSLVGTLSEACNFASTKPGSLGLLNLVAVVLVDIALRYDLVLKLSELNWI